MLCPLQGGILSGLISWISWDFQLQPVLGCMMGSLDPINTSETFWNHIKPCRASMKRHLIIWTMLTCLWISSSLIPVLVSFRAKSAMAFPKRFDGHGSHGSHGFPVDFIQASRRPRPALLVSGGAQALSEVAEEWLGEAGFAKQGELLSSLRESLPETDYIMKMVKWCKMMFFMGNMTGDGLVVKTTRHY